MGKPPTPSALRPRPSSRTRLRCGFTPISSADSRRTERRVRKFAKLLDQHADLVFLIVLKIVMQAVDRAFKVAFLADFPQQFRLDAVRLGGGEILSHRRADFLASLHARHFFGVASSAGIAI